MYIYFHIHVFIFRDTLTTFVQMGDQAAAMQSHIPLLPKINFSNMENVKTNMELLRDSDKDSAY